MLAIAACGVADTVSDGTLPHQDPGNPNLGSVLGPVTLTGAMVDGKICLWSGSGDGRIPILVPAGYNVQLDPGVRVLDETGTVVVRPGMPVWLGGGVIQATVQVHDKLGECLDGSRVFLVGRGGFMSTPPGPQEPR